MAVGIVTLTPRSGSARNASGPMCILCGELGGVDFVLNVLLFVPLGVVLLPFARRVLPATLLGLATSTFIEALQLHIVAGRDAALGDVIANTIGAALGAWLCANASALWAPAAKHRWTRPLAWGFTVAATLGLSAYAVVPRFRGESIAVQFQPVRHGYATFEGTLLRMSVAGVPVRPAMWLRKAEHPDIFSHAAPSVSAVLQAGPSVANIAPIARLSSPSVEGFMIARRGNDLVYRFLSGARNLRLRAPLYVLPGAFAEPAGTATPDSLSAVVDRGTVHLDVCHADGRCTSGLSAVSVDRGWMLFAPWDIASGRVIATLSALWMGALFLPLGYWSHDLSRRGAAALAGAVLVSGAALLPQLAGAHVAPPAAWTAALCGIAAGLMAAGIAERRLATDP